MDATDKRAKILNLIYWFDGRPFGYMEEDADLRPDGTVVVSTCVSPRTRSAIQTRADEAGIRSGELLNRYIKRGLASGRIEAEEEPESPVSITIKIPGDFRRELLDAADEDGRAMEKFVPWLLGCGLTHFQEFLKEERDPPLIPGREEEEVELPF